MSTTITLTGGATLTATDPDDDDNRTITIDHPDAPADLRNLEIGRITTMGHGRGFQVSLRCAWSGAGLRPETLRAIATLIEREMPEEDQ